MDTGDETTSDESKAQRSGHACYFTVLNIWTLHLVGSGRVKLILSQEILREVGAQAPGAVVG